MKQTFNMKRQLAINLKYCYSARRATQNMSESHNLPQIPTITTKSHNLPTIYSRSSFQHGTPWGEEFSESGRKFLTMSNSYELRPKHFPEEGDFAGVFAPP